MNIDAEKYLVATDQLLVEWTLGGDNSAFDALAMRYSEALKRYLRGRVVSSSNSAQDIDDLTQESLIKALVHLGSYDPKYTFGQWIYTIARNTCIDFCRKRHDDVSIDEKFALPPEERGPNPEQKIINSQTRTHIEKCIAMLPEKQQGPFKMRFLDEYSYEEIAEKLQMPMGSVKTIIHRSRTQIIKLLRE